MCVAFLTPLTILDPIPARFARISTTGHFACRRSRLFCGKYAICLRVSVSFFFSARFLNSLKILSDFLCWILGETQVQPPANWARLVDG